MLPAILRLVFVVAVTVSLVDGVRRGYSRGRYPHASRPISSREKLINLKSQLGSCVGKFFCDVSSVNSLCEVECVDGNNVCDGIMHCKNGRDELNCQGQTCPPCPPCPTCGPCVQTPSPCTGGACTSGDFRCKDGSMCISATEICNEVIDCPGGEDESLPICGGEATMCSTYQAPIGNTCTSFAPLVFVGFMANTSGEQCREFCNQMSSSCAGYAVEVVAAGGGDCYLYSSVPQPMESCTVGNFHVVDCAN